jgi:hypothetical protein
LQFLFEPQECSVLNHGAERFDSAFGRISQREKSTPRDTDRSLTQPTNMPNSAPLQFEADH